jgi:hypothetical protein
MTKRDLAFLLIGMGIGLILSAIGVVELAFMFHHMFIVGFVWQPSSIAMLAAPFLFIAAGGVVLRFSQRQQ